MDPDPAGGSGRGGVLGTGGSRTGGRDNAGEPGTEDAKLVCPAGGILAAAGGGEENPAGGVLTAAGAGGSCLYCMVEIGVLVVPPDTSEMLGKPFGYLTVAAAKGVIFLELTVEYPLEYPLMLLFPSPSVPSALF